MTAKILLSSRKHQLKWNTNFLNWESVSVLEWYGTIQSQVKMCTAGQPQLGIWRNKYLFCTVSGHRYQDLTAVLITALQFCSLCCHIFSSAWDLLHWLSTAILQWSLQIHRTAGCLRLYSVTIDFIQRGDVLKKGFLPSDNRSKAAFTEFHKLYINILLNLITKPQNLCAAPSKSNYSAKSKSIIHEKDFNYNQIYDNKCNNDYIQVYATASAAWQNYKNL